MRSSLYETDHPSRRETQSAIAFGRITAVFPEERLCEVKTFMGTGATEDLHIPKCQWLNMDANPEGDESSIIPRVNSTGLVFFINGEPFIFGYWRALTGDGKALAGETPEKGTEGDKFISTVAGNRIRVRSNGVIEVISKDTLRSVYFPKDGLLFHICQNYEFRTDGGYQTWKRLEGQNTLSVSEFRKDLLRSSIIVEEKGFVDNQTIRRVRIGPGLPGVQGISLPIYEETVKNTGEVDLAIGSLKEWKLNIKPSGEFSVKTGATAPAFTLTTQASGDTKLTITDKANVHIKPDGEIQIDNPGATLKITPSGEVSLVAKDKLKVDAQGGVEIKTAGEAEVTASGTVKVTGSTIQLNGSSGNVLTTATAPVVDYITGAPHMGVPTVQAG